LGKETEALFIQNERLEGKLEQMQSVINQVRKVIKENEDVHVSFGVYESLNSLSEVNVKEYRVLECLKVQRTSFMPSFDD
jgi:hypothetical protein